MRYTTRSIKPNLQVYVTPVATRQQSRNRLSDPESDNKELYHRRITELELELQTLNILDHPLRIIDICNQIRILRKEIARNHS